MKPGIRSVSVEDLLGRRLNDIEEKYAPDTLHIGGPMAAPLPIPRVSVIGTRAPSTRGLFDARSIAGFLAENRTVVVSGLARGIDTAAHREAIDRGGRTIAVLGTPLDRTYLAANAGLQQEIMRGHLAVSQYTTWNKFVK